MIALNKEGFTPPKKGAANMKNYVKSFFKGLVDLHYAELTHSVLRKDA